MKPLKNDWITKAEADYASARRELRARKSPNFDAACFHAQQCAEKYLKARIAAAPITFSTTSDCVRLLNLCLPGEPSWQALSLAVNVLKKYATGAGYPGAKLNKSKAQDAVACCRVIRFFARQSLGLKN